MKFSLFNVTKPKDYPYVDRLRNGTIAGWALQCLTGERLSTTTVSRAFCSRAFLVLYSWNCTILLYPSKLYFIYLANVDPS